MRTFVLALALVFALGACATAPSGDFCSVAQPRRPSKPQIAVMTAAEKRADLAHNRFGADHCGWRP